MFILFVIFVIYSYYRLKTQTFNSSIQRFVSSDSILPHREQNHTLTLLTLTTTERRTTVPTVQFFTSSNSKIILFWTSHFQNFIKNNKLALGKIECGAKKHSCFVTTNKSFIMTSNAVVFHGEGHTFMKDLYLVHPLNRPLGQRWVYYNKEATDRSMKLDLLSQWNSLFNWTMSYKYGSDIRLGFAKITPNNKHQGGYDPKMNYSKGKSRTAIILLSNCQSNRLKIVKTLQKYIDVDVYGRCGRSCPTTRWSCYSLIPRYKFYLAFENSICRDLLTEKSIFNGLMNGVVPVIISGANLSNPALIPPKSYINAREFETIRELADYLKHVASQPEIYNTFFKWRDNWNVSMNSMNSTDIPCAICEKLYATSNQEMNIIHDLPSLFNPIDECEKYPVYKDVVN